MLVKILKKIVNEIKEIRFNEENIIVKGYVIFDTEDMSKREIEEKEPFIDGIKVRTENENQEIFIKNWKETAALKLKNLVGELTEIDFW